MADDKKAADKRKAKAKSTASAPREKLVAELVKAGYPKGDIRPYWSDVRLKSEMAQAVKVADRKKARLASAQKTEKADAE